MADERIPVPPVPQSRVVTKRRRGFSAVWIVPIVAAVIGVWVAVVRIMSEGPSITIVFNSAEGLEAGKTKVEYHGVEVGTITSIVLSEDRRHVVATAQMAPKTEDLLVDDSQFWVVRPRISGANITGLGTLISGAYIGLQVGASKAQKRSFIALETPPIVTGGAAGRFFILKTSDLGSLDTGTPVFFRRLQVGRIASYQLDKDGKEFTLKIFVKAPYDQYVTPNTRFWQASGIDMQLSANGLSVQTQSILSILIGGVAFATPANGPVLNEADQNAVFTVYSDRATAFEPPPQHPETYELIFNESVRGLEPGAPVELRGIRIGDVADIRAQFDAKTMKFSAPVVIHLDPQRLGVKVVDLKKTADREALRRKFIDALVANGVRAQLKTGNLLTGSAFVEFDFFPDAKPATVDWSQTPVQLPTVPGQIEATEANVESIIKKVNEMPLQQIGEGLRKSLDDLDRTLVTAQDTLTSARGTIDNAGKLVGPNSAQAQELNNALQELTRAARSIRVLADYLERHPEALLRGKSGEAK
ncbi:MAG TPA: MlaD family protein [Candidatus Binataceae bacterium]|nr:MlaD family protein [Candidatus Binataceae bacterium]